MMWKTAGPSMIRWSLLAILLAALMQSSGVSALPHRGHVLAARSALTSGTSSASSAAQSTVSRVAQTSQADGSQSNKKNEANDEEFARELQRTIQTQMEKESVDGGIKFDLGKILGKMYKGENINVYGGISKEKNNTSVSESLPRGTSTSSVSLSVSSKKSKSPKMSKSPKKFKSKMLSKSSASSTSTSHSTSSHSKSCLLYTSPSPRD